MGSRINKFINYRSSISIMNGVTQYVQNQVVLGEVIAKRVENAERLRTNLVFLNEFSDEDLRINSANNRSGFSPVDWKRCSDPVYRKLALIDQHPALGAEMGRFWSYGGIIRDIANDLMISIEKRKMHRGQYQMLFETRTMGLIERWAKEYELAHLENAT